jgi:uncharacterized protein
VVTRHATKHQRHLICLSAVRAIIKISLTAVLMCCTGTMATEAADLYRAQAIVTGQGEANRIIGFASCLEDVLIKVSGAQKLAGDRRLAAHKSKAKGFVRAFSYHDQMSGTPTRDEQGTRDRPYDLIVDFDEKNRRHSQGTWPQAVAFTPSGPWGLCRDATRPEKAHGHS